MGRLLKLYFILSFSFTTKALNYDYNLYVLDFFLFRKVCCHKDAYFVVIIILQIIFVLLAWLYKGLFAGYVCERRCGNFGCLKNSSGCFEVLLDWACSIRCLKLVPFWLIRLTVFIKVTSLFGKAFLGYFAVYCLIIIHGTWNLEVGNEPSLAEVTANPQTPVVHIFVNVNSVTFPSLICCNKLKYNVNVIPLKEYRYYFP